MKLEELIGTAKDTLTVGRVYGQPFEKDGVTVVPVASVTGGGGGGSGRDGEGQEGEGGGFGMAAKPAGVYVVGHGKVRWQPAVDVNRLVVSLVALTAVIALARVRLARVQRARR